FALRTLLGLLILSMAALTAHGLQTTITDAAKGAYDFDSLSGVIDADQVDYFSGNWSYALPLGEVEGAGGLSLPLAMRYSSAVTGTDRLIRLGTAQQISTLSKGTVTLNNATWVGLGWNLEFGAIKVTGGYELKDTTSPINHPFSFNLSMVLPDGSHRLVRQLDDSQRAATPGVPLPATNVYFAENRRFMDVRWNFDRNAPLASTWTVKTVSGLTYTFGAVTIGGRNYGMNQTVKGGTVQNGRFDELMPEMVYQWNLAEIRDQAGNTIRFRYASDGPVTTVRDWAKERAAETRSFRNLLDFADLDPRFPNGVSEDGNIYNLTVVKTFHTGHLDEVILAGSDGKVVRRITTETSEREDLHVARHGGVAITYDNYFDTPAGQNLTYGHHLVRNNRNYRMYDGISSAHRLDALKVTDAAGSQVARYVFRYADDKSLQARPPVAPGDNARTLLLEEIAVMGTGSAASDQLPPWRFTNTLGDSYRITKILTPAGGEMKIAYEGVAPPDTTLKYDDAYFDRARRIKRMIRDADGGGGPVPPDITTFNYIQTAPVMDIIDDRRVRRITFPIVDEVLPGGHGKTRRDFVGESDLDALGLSATNKKQESERDIRRGLLEQTIHYDASGTVVQRQRTNWQVTTQGTWTGRWQPFYHPGIPQQAYWIRAQEQATTRDGVITTTQLTHNAKNGLVASETLKSGSHTLRVTETSYHADQVTRSPVTLVFGQPVLDTSLSTANRTHAAFLSTGDPPTASVEAFLNADSAIESSGFYDFAGRRFSVSGRDALRIRGVLGTDQLQGGDNMYAGVTVTVAWKNAGSRPAASLTQVVPLAGGRPDPEEKSFDVLMPVPSSAESARVNLTMYAGVYKPQQAVYRKIRVYAKDIQVTGMSADDPEDVFLKGAHILDRPHVVTVRDGSGTKLQSARHRYGRFVHGNNAIIMPDTTSVWLDRNADGQVDTGEWIDRQVAAAYDAYGNLTQAKDAHGTVSSTIMGYGRMRPVAAFTGADASKVTAEVFDDHAGWDALVAAGPWLRTDTRPGAITLEAGAITLDNAVAERTLPSLAAGVFEVDARVQATDERTEVTLGQNRIRWVFERDGSVKAADNGTLKDTGARYVPGRWHRLRIAWKNGRWWARMDGARYPKTGAWNMRGRRGVVDAVRLANGVQSVVASFDNLRAWPEGAQPGAMTTYDPVTLDAIAVTDANGHTVRYARDGLRRVVQTTDGAGRLTAQRDHRFSRGISATSAYNTSRPNRQTDIAYLSKDGHKDLSKDGHRVITRGTGDRLEEGVSLETTGPYVVEAGETVDLKASVRIVLGPGFHAKAGSNFRAGIDPRAGGDGVTGTGAVAYNQRKATKRSVKLGPSSVLETGRVEGRVTARADFHPASAISGKTVIMAFDDRDAGDYVRMVYDRGRVKLESRIGGTSASTAMVPGYNRNWPWARVEMELVPSGRVNAWMYNHRDTRFKGASASVAVPANWTPAFKAAGESGDAYLANLYVGKAEAVTTYYDGLARSMQTRAGAEANDIVTRTTYNRAGKPDRLLGPVHQAPSYDYCVLSDAAAGSRITRTAYDDDPLLRVSRVVPPGHDNNSAVDTRYGNWGTESGLGRSFQTVDDEKGVATTRVYDPYGRMRHVIADSAGTNVATRNNRTSYAYDALDRLISTTMPGGGTTRYAYDTLGRMTSRHHPDADGATLYKYDDLGRVRFSQDARQRASGTGANRKITYTVYDDFGRVTRVGEATANFSELDPERSYPFENDASSWRSRMTYDGGDLVAGGEIEGGGPNYAQGRLTKAQENTDADAAAEVVHRYAYDHLGNVRVKQVSIEGLTGAKTAAYTHDLAGRVTRLTYPDGAQARYAYDSAGRLSRVGDVNGNTLAAYTHTAAGNIATHIVGQGEGDTTADGVVTGTYAYNPREWVTEIDYAGKFSSELTYDLAGNVTRQMYSHGSAASRTADYAYDNLYRITGFDLTGGTSRDYAYDRSGNLTSVVTDSSRLTYNYSGTSTPNRLDSTTGAGGQTYAYNQNGWMTRKGADTVRYDYRGLTTGVGSARYLMDPDRRRVKKTVGSATTYYLRGPGGSVLAEYSGQTVSARYVYAGARRIVRIAGDSASYYLADHLGSTRSLVDEAGIVTAAYDYWPYGKVLASSGTGATHFRFTGHERDAESGLDYMPARSYAYDVGRFLRPDPMQDEYPGISPYAYAANNPLKYVDPDGAYFESFWDVANIGIGLVSLAQNVSEGSYGWAALDVVGLAVDAGATIVPGLPGGAGTLIKSIRGARAVNQADNATDVANTIDAGRSASSGTGAKGTLRDRLGDPPPGMENAQAHHDLPQARRFRKHWERAGLDINNPSYGRWVSGSPQGNHQKWSRAFNEEWDDFFKQYPDASREQILNKMDELRNKGEYQ
ncbi:MAG: hypothetical protein F4207_01040, partial [Gemmatimonadetes bacterium]|nr:hypothetical protein [Gemmatimonadota bacterium]